MNEERKKNLTASGKLEGDPKLEFTVQTDRKHKGSFTDEHGDEHLRFAQ